MTEHTIKSLIGSDLSTKAFEHLGVPLGGTLTVNDDGTCSWDMEAEDRDVVLSKLLGAAIAHYAVETMVMPSNADRLDDIHEFLKLVTGSHVARPLTLGAFEERFEDFLYDIESVQQNLRHD